jgi:hypothetical protein
VGPPERGEYHASTELACKRHSISRDAAQSRMSVPIDWAAERAEPVPLRPQTPQHFFDRVGSAITAGSRLTAIHCRTPRNAGLTELSVGVQKLDSCPIPVLAVVACRTLRGGPVVLTQTRPRGFL